MTGPHSMHDQLHSALHFMQAASSKVAGSEASSRVRVAAESTVAAKSNVMQARQSCQELIGRNARFDVRHQGLGQLPQCCMQPLLLEPDFAILQIQEDLLHREFGLRSRLTADDARQTRPMI